MKDDTIKRKDAIGAINGWLKRNHFPEIGDGILYLVPSADKPQKVIAQIIFDEEKLREIMKEAIEHFKKKYEITNRPQGKWINGHYINGVYYKRCDQCFAEIEDSFFGEGSFDVNFCPNCGADMRYDDNERHNI